MSKPDRALQGCSYVIAAIFGAIMLLILLNASDLRPSLRNDISNADFLAVILSALGVMVAILTFFLAILAIFGWTAFRTIIEDKFEDLFRRHFNASNAEYGNLVSQLVEDARAQQAASAIAEAQPEEENEEDEHNPEEAAE